MKVLVTGSAGFIGFHLIRALCSAGHQVTGIDNLNNHYDQHLKYDRLRECGITWPDGEAQSATMPGYRFLKVDICDCEALRGVFAMAEDGFDAVVHLAARAGVRDSGSDPASYIQSNVVGFVNLLECCRHAGTGHLIYASSSSVYGLNQSVPFCENHNTDSPASIYAATKKSNELLAHSYSHLYKLPATGLRFFTVYGPWGRPDMVPYIFARSIMEGRPLRVFNYGDMMRDFTYVEDVARSIMLVMAHPPKWAPGHPSHRVLNVGSSRPVPLGDFIGELERAMGRSAPMELHPMQPGEIRDTFADASHLERLTGYRPTTELHEGLNRFAQWISEYEEE